MDFLHDAQLLSRATCHGQKKKAAPAWYGIWFRHPIHSLRPVQFSVGKTTWMEEQVERERERETTSSVQKTGQQGGIVRCPCLFQPEVVSRQAAIGQPGVAERNRNGGPARQTHSNPRPPAVIRTRATHAQAQLEHTQRNTHTHAHTCTGASGSPKKIQGAAVREGFASPLEGAASAFQRDRGVSTVAFAGAAPPLAPERRGASLEPVCFLPSLGFSNRIPGPGTCMGVSVILQG